MTSSRGDIGDSACPAAALDRAPRGFQHRLDLRLVRVADILASGGACGGRDLVLLSGGYRGDDCPPHPGWLR
jgi:hypothetical protein